MSRPAASRSLADGGDGSLVRLAAFLLMSLVWGLTWMPMKLASEAVPPILLAAVRFIVAGLCFGLYAAVTRLPLRPSRPGRVLLASLLITTGCYGPLFWGLARAPTGISALVNFALMPVFIIGIGSLYGLEPITRRRLASVALGAAGLALLFSTRSGAAGEGLAVTAGLAGVVVGTASYAWGAVLSRPLVQDGSPVALAFWQTLLGGVALLPVSALVEGADFSGLAGFAEPKALFGLAFLVGAGTLVGFSIYLWLVREWGAFRAGLYSFVSPAVAVGVGIWWGGEAFGWPEAVGTALMMAATATVITEPRRNANVSAS